MSYRLETPDIDPISFDNLQGKLDAQKRVSLKGSWELKAPGIARERQFEKCLCSQKARFARKRALAAGSADASADALTDGHSGSTSSEVSL